MRKAVVRAIGGVVVLELAYLLLANGLLNLPSTEALLNRHEPGGYSVSWERASSWYPLHLRASGLFASGETSGRQWQFEASQLSATLSVLPLLHRTVRVRTVTARDVELRVRTRPAPDEDDGAVSAHHPPLRDRERRQPVALPEPPDGLGWRIAVDDLQAIGEHRIWVNQVRTALRGSLSVDIDSSARGGPLSLPEGRIDAVMTDSLLVRGEPVVAAGGKVAGRFDVAPFRPSRERAREALDYLTADVRVDLDVDSFGILDGLMSRFGELEIDGEGTLRGRLHYVRGELGSHTRMEARAPRLALHAPPYVLRGAGRIDISTTAPGPASVSTRLFFDSLSAFRTGGSQALFRGEALEVILRASARIPTSSTRSSEPGRVDVRIPRVLVSDVSAYQYLLPEKWNFRLNGGAGSLEGRMTLSPTALQVELRLRSDQADLEFGEARYSGDLDVNLSLAGDGSSATTLDLAGTGLAIDNVRITSASRKNPLPWRADLSITEGSLSVAKDKSPETTPGFGSLVRALRDRRVRDVLSVANADVTARLSVSDLSWLDALFSDPFNLSLSGTGVADADIIVRDGWISAGSRLSLSPRDLEIGLLDYVARGQGDVLVTVGRGGKLPEFVLDTALVKGSLKRRDDVRAVVEEVRFDVSAKARKAGADEPFAVTAIDVRMPSARVDDISAYNRYLPDRLPLRLVAGEAQLVSEIHLTPGSATGYVKLESAGFRSRIGEQHLSGALAMAINIEDGVPIDMDFDISGSSLRIEGVRVEGRQQTFDQPDWAARVELEKARVLWKRPIRIDAQAAIAMRDSRPLMALLANQRGKHGWIEKMLTEEDIRGTVRFQLSPEALRVPYAFAGSDRIDIGVKGLIDARTREGVIFARYGRLQGILEIKDGKRDFDVVGAKRQFDEYMPGR